MLNKINIIMLLVGVVFVESAIDYDIFFSSEQKKRSEAVYQSAGLVDKMFVKSSRAKYENIVTNNVFSPAVKDKKEVVKVSKNMGEPMLDLRGVTITPDQKFAILWDSRDRKSVIVNEGEDVKSWKVLTIMSDRVVMESNDNRYELFVKNDQKNKP